jgi:DNA-binding Lrp family transcriptional regulator
MSHLDTTDREILRILRDDGRISNSDLAAKVGLSPSSCLRRVRILEKSGVIRGYAALIDIAPAEGGLVVLTRITLERQTEDFLNRFETAARRCPEVQDCYLMTGSADYLMKLKVKDTPDYERLHKDVLSRLPGVARLQSSFAIRTVVSARAMNSHP